MQRDHLHFSEEINRYFDISHSFKIGLSTYHILELRRSPPDSENNYFIFNCDNHSNEYSRNVTARRSATMFDRNQQFNPGAGSTDATRRKNSSAHLTSPTLPKTSGQRVGSCRRTQSPKRMEIHKTNINQLLVRTIKCERQAILNSMRKEININNGKIIRTIKKQNKTLLDATKDESKGTEIIRLLEEQRKILTENYEKCIESTVSSIEQLKETLIEKLSGQNHALASIEQMQTTIIQTIELQVKQLIEKNQQILNVTSTYKKSISELENNLNAQLKQFFTSNTNDAEAIEKLLQNHKNLITKAIAEQQQNLPMDQIKTAVLDALNEQSLNMTENTVNSNDLVRTRINRVSQQTLSIDRTDFHQQLNSPSVRLPATPDQSNMKKRNDKLQNLEFIKLSIISPPQAKIYPKLSVNGVEYSRYSYTLSQPDTSNLGLRHFYIAPPVDSGPYEIELFAKSEGDSRYRAAVTVAFPGLNLRLSNGLPQVRPAFEKHQCILIEPFRRYLEINDEILIHMIVPKAHTMKILNGQELLLVENYEYQDYTLKKKLKVLGKVEVLASWDGKTDVSICVFN